MKDIVLHEDFESIERENVETFKKFGTRSGSKLVHRCVICGGETCIDEGHSRKGSLFVCGPCSRDERMFGSPSVLGVHRWIALMSGDDARMWEVAR